MNRRDVSINMMVHRYRGLWMGVILALGLVLTFWLGMDTDVISAARLRIVPGDPMLHPRANAHAVPRDTVISITYDTAIDPVTVTTRTFTVHAMETGQILEAYSVNGREIKVTPAHPFKPGELVQVSATTGTLSVDASAPLTPTVWQFWAEALLGTARFTEPLQLGELNTHGLDVGDLNGDGNLDLILANSSAHVNEVWLNQGVGVFTRTQVFSGSTSLAVALGDLDGDSDLDAYVANRGAGNTVWLNDGAGVLSDTGQTLGVAKSYDVALGDVDGDGDLDAIVGNHDNQNNRVWLNDGTGNFAGGQVFDNRSSIGLALGDLDGDGDLDVFFANYFSAGNTVWFNDGTGTFVNSGQSLGGRDSSEVALGDVDGDGDLDAVVANRGVGDSVWLNDGTGSFTLDQSLGGSARTLGVALGDLDGDDDLDAFFGGQGYHTVWLNAGGVYTDSGQTLGEFYSYSVKIGDLNGDGALDLVSARYRDADNTATYPSQIWFNDLYRVYLPLAIR